MKNTDSYLLLMSLRVSLVIAGCFESKALERAMLFGNLSPPRSCFVKYENYIRLCAPPLKLQAIHQTFFINIP